MGEIVVNNNGLELRITTLSDAVGLAIVVLALGVACAAVAYAITRYTDVDLHAEIKAQDIIRHLI